MSTDAKSIQSRLQHILVRIPAVIKKIVVIKSKVVKCVLIRYALHTRTNLIYIVFFKRYLLLLNNSVRINRF